ncbi:hypothetical protein [Natrarchaeobaculum sulfurireducens]|uniref:hypothetical protein n=1 Tax=Natrarchaeobaculum sulfurireducens TaxID=2044521 RepID=UPI00105AB06E|nr:hypothetical protein [Natrarchaeobaculum sulfurireducens]
MSNYGSGDFEEKATVRANSHVHDYVSSLLREEELLGAGVSLGIDYISVDEIDDVVVEDEFERAKELATIVNQRYEYDVEGELISQEPVDLDTLREHLPRTVIVETSSDTNRYTAVLPVVVHRFWDHPNYK